MFILFIFFYIEVFFFFFFLAAYFLALCAREVCGQNVKSCVSTACYAKHMVSRKVCLVAVGSTFFTTNDYFYYRLIWLLIFAYFTTLVLSCWGWKRAFASKKTRRLCSFVAQQDQQSDKTSP